MSLRTVMARFDPLLASGPIASSLAAIILAALLVGGIGTIRTGRWPYRVLLVLGALSWPFPGHPLQGPVVLPLTYLHGIHLADLISVAAFIVAVKRQGNRPRESTTTDM